ncbi:MAG: hypothetical protein RJA36_1401 [Pseudomonadota bacterium]|jgi:peptide subunit release factor 1 (eRF1)
MPNLDELETDSDGEPCVWRNHYECDQCGAEWTDDWSCQCNDHCPGCDAEIEPTNSDWLPDDLTEDQLAAMEGQPS